MQLHNTMEVGLIFVKKLEAKRWDLNSNEGLPIAIAQMY